MVAYCRFRWGSYRKNINKKIIKKILNKLQNKVKIQIGGGIRNLDDIDFWFKIQLIE